MKKVGMIGVLQNPTERISSHNAGYTFIYKSMLEDLYETNIDTLKEGDDWDSYDILWINEGVNFKDNQWNLFGGVSESLLTKLNKLNSYAGEVYFWGDFKPNYQQLCDKRGIDLSFTKFISNKVDIISKCEKLVVGDSHSMSVYQKGFNISRNDGKTLNGFVKEGLFNYVNENTKHLRFYAGNIDVRHHMCRIYKDNEIVAAVKTLVEKLESQILDLKLEKVEIVSLLPIEHESRKLPKTGYYKGQPFYGTWDQRDATMEIFNIQYKLMCIRNGWTFLKWVGLENDNFELDFKFMEARQSVHLAPSSYMFGSTFIKDKKSKKDIKTTKTKIVKKELLKNTSRSFNINENILLAIDDYHKKSLTMQRYHFEFNPDGYTGDELKKVVNDDLIFNVPIYDMLDRKYAAFSSFLEALMLGEEDPKGNGKFFDKVEMNQSNWILLFYLFRLCGSGINYKPKYEDPFGTHGFGNFWLVEQLKDGITSRNKWFMALEDLSRPFSDNKGYMLPQISYKDQEGGGHLKRFILEESEDLVESLHNFLLESDGPRTIIESVEFMNSMLVEKGFKKQNFVMSATMADIAEYFPKLIDPKSMIYAGTNARKCIKAIFNKNRGYSRLQFESDCIQFLADRYDSVPYSVEDSRLCDVVRYFQGYQSKYHIAQNNGVKYDNNTTLKKVMSSQEYKEFVKSISK